MKRRNISGLYLLTCIFLFGNAGDANGQKPIPKDKKTPSCEGECDEALKLWQRDIDAYRKHTKDPESLRPQAEEFLRVVQLGELPRVRGPGPAKTAAMGKKLIEQGCKDTLVKSYYAKIISKPQRYDKALSTLQRAVDALRKSDYPPECRRMAMFAYCRVGENLSNVPRWNELRKEAIKLAAARVGDATIGPEGQRVVLRELSSFFRCDAINWQDSEALNNACKKLPKADPWTLDMIAGRYYYALAWHHRSGGYASSVKPEGFRLFRENLKKAAEHYEKAWKLRPEFPEAASDMVAVATAGGSDLSPREWFDRAVAAQMDYLLAYDYLRWRLRPRWGGSHEEMYRFGCECADTERYKTNVPFFLLKELRNIDGEQGGNGEVWKRPGVYAKVKRVLEGMAREPSRAVGKRLHLAKPSVMSIHAAVAGLAGEYADARRLLDELGNRLDRKTFASWSGGLENALATTYAMSGKGSSDIVKARKLFGNGSQPLSNAVLQEARDSFKKALEADDDRQSKAYCQNWIDAVDDYMAFNSGKWVEKKFNTNKLNWVDVSGVWSVKNDRSVTGIACKPYSRVMLRLVAVPPVPLEIEFEIKLSTIHPGKMILGLFVPQRNQGVILHKFYVNTGSRKIGVEIMGKTKEKATGLYRTSRFRVQLADGRAVLYINDELCFDHRDRNFRPSSNLNIGCNTHLYPVLKLIVSNVRIRKWDPAKEPAEEPTKEPAKEPAKEKETP